MPDATIRTIKDQLRRARTYIGLLPSRGRHAFVRDLRRKMRDVQQALGDATSDRWLPKKYVLSLFLLQGSPWYCDDDMYLVWVLIGIECLLHVFFNFIAYAVSLEKLEQWSWH